VRTGAGTGIPRLTHRIADLESLRGISILMVLVFHARNSGFDWDLPRWTHVVKYYFDFWPGVDVFFAVSGFIIARSLLPAIAACGDFTAFVRVATAFWVRRAWRLLPSAWLWLWITLAMSAVLNRDNLFSSFHTNFEATIAGMLAVANIRFAVTFLSAPYGVSSHYWSLSLEEQFYFTLPVLAFLLRRNLVWCLVAALAFVFCLTPNNWLGTFRVHAILLGVLLAIFSQTPAWALTRPDFLNKNRLRRALALALPLGLMSTLAPFLQQITPVPFDLIGLLSASLVLIAGHDGGFLRLGPPIDRVLHWLGARSYALYIVHLPMMIAHHQIWRMLMPSVPPALHPLYCATMIGTILGSAALNYRFVEIPLRRRGATIADRMLARAVG